ncbi:DUF1549 domain-containing protein [Pendulispora albinea]|uniref:DUF1549 and DUF1553 domain-containing protein n=1 Tax=Pendulispora albinea TaxID=2741071 RepID=A0ABZ2LQ25_9BACT
MKFVRGPLAMVSVVVMAGGCASGGPAPVPVRAPPAVANRTGASPARVSMRSAEIDARLRAEWQSKKIETTARVDDAGFLRRVHLDLTGRVPSAQAVEAFLADRSADKRAKVIDALLASPAYADHFTNYWDRALLGRDVRNNVDRAEFRRWLHERFDANVGYDVWVRDLVSATGLTTGPKSDDGSPLPAATSDVRVNGATNWYVRYMDNPADLAGTASRLFLGVQIQCAQCHDHKTEKWRMSDFQAFTASFMQTRAQLFYPQDKDKKGTRPFDVEDVEKPRRKAKGMDLTDYKNAVPRALDGTELAASGRPRAALAAWITAKRNPWFARAVVNRMWAKLLGRGFFEPIDDIRESNPPAVPGLLDALAQDFVASGYDLKHLLRLVANTEAYQLAARPKAQLPTWGAPVERGSAPAGDERGAAEGAAQVRRDEDALWSYFHMDRLGPDELLDSLAQATGDKSLLEKGAGGDQIRAGLRKQFAFLFDVDEEADHHDEFDGTIAQALWMINGNVLNRSVQVAPGSALAEVIGKPGRDEAKIRALYMRTLSRPPTAEETEHWVKFVNANPMRQAYEDLLWALLNSSEFLFNH